MLFKTRMIRVKGDKTSEAYANYCKQSWFGFDLRYYDAVTPETLHEQSGLTFGMKGSRELTDTEKACFYSQYNLWKKCAVENTPILILEHDAWLKQPSCITYNPHLMVQYFGRHAMEAVLFHPQFCKMLINYCKRNPVIGPMSAIDTKLGFFNKTQQSRFGLPHSRYQGEFAPVDHVIDPKLGTTVDHDGRTAQRLKSGDADLFKLVNI